MELKTMKDIKALQDSEMQIFSDEYTYFLRDMEVFYYNNPGGKEKIRAVLDEYDDEARAYILHDLYLRGVSCD